MPGSSRAYLQGAPFTFIKYMCYTYNASAECPAHWSRSTVRALAQARAGPEGSRPFVSPLPTSGACHRRHSPRHSIVIRSVGGGLGGRTPRPPLGGKGWRGSRQPLPHPASTGQGEAPAAPPGATREDVILLDVDGMHCAGCVSRVRKLLEDQPAVSAASVSLATETALARVRVAGPRHAPAGREAKALEDGDGARCAPGGGGGTLDVLGADLAQVGFPGSYRLCSRDVGSVLCVRKTKWYCCRHKGLDAQWILAW